MNILFIIKDLFPFGGTPRKLLMLSKKIDRNKYKIVIICHGKKQNEDLEEGFRKAGIKIIWLKSTKNWNIRLILDIVSIIKKHKIDLVSTFFARANIYGRIASIISHIPVIVNEVGIHRNESLVIKVMDNLLAPFTDRVICNSLATFKKVASAIPLLRRDRVSIVYNGIDVNEFQKEAKEEAESLKHEIEFSSSSFILSYIGGFISLRDHQTLINSFKKIHQHFPYTKLVLVGDGPLLENMRKLSQDLFLENAVYFLGYRSDIAKILKLTNIYINPACQEGFGINIIEAMALGIPVIGTNAGAIPEIIEDGVNGLLFSPGDSESLYQKVSELIQKPEKKKRLAEIGQKTVYEKFTSEIFVEKTLEVFQKVIKND